MSASAMVTTNVSGTIGVYIYPPTDNFPHPSFKSHRWQAEVSCCLTLLLMRRRVSGLAMNRQSWLYISRPKHALSSLVWALTDIEIWSFAVPPQPSLNLHTLQQLAKALLRAQTPACYQLLLPVLSLFQINLHPPQKTVYHPSIWRQILSLYMTGWFHCNKMSWTKISCV